MYDDRPDNGNRPILALRINAEGKSMGKAINLTEKEDIATTPSANWNPRAAFNPKTGGYSVVWEHRPFNALNFELTALNLSADGKPGRPIIIKKSHGDFEPHTAIGSIPLDVAFHQPSGKLLVAYYAVNPNGTENYYLATLDPLLKTAPPSASVKLIKEDNTSVIYFGTNETILRRDINLQGRATGPAVQAFNAPLSKTELGYLKVFFPLARLARLDFFLLLKSLEPLKITSGHNDLTRTVKPVGKPTKALSGGSFAPFALSALPPTSIDHPFLWMGEVSLSDSRSGIIRLKLTLPN